VPTVEVTGGEFFWLSAPKPIVPPGTPFLPDLQTWMRNTDLDPDWSRVGGDIVGGMPAPAFNATFSLVGQVPEASTLSLLGFGLVGLAVARGRRHRPWPSLRFAAQQPEAAPPHTGRHRSWSIAPRSVS
jgi:hypothetical protein